jgi:hypothetical protein
MPIVIRDTGTTERNAMDAIKSRLSDAIGELDIVHINLRAALHEATPVEGIVLLDLIEISATLRRRTEALMKAHQAERKP